MVNVPRSLGRAGSRMFWPFKRRDRSDEPAPYRRSEVLDRHFRLQEVIQARYRERDRDGSALADAIRACERQIAMAPRAARELKRLYPARDGEPELPRHVGFEQLAIIREKQGDCAVALRLASTAAAQGWNGDWASRISRCRRKLEKQGNRG